MKSKLDPRHKRRREAVRELFAISYTAQQLSPLAREVFSKKEDIDQEIASSAPEWPVEKLNKIDLAILRLATYEFLFTDTPSKVIVDEAVELAKEYGAESSSSFVNGVLGDILKRHEEKVK